MAMRSVLEDASGPARWAADQRMVTVVPWFDPVVDADGFDPRSTYVEYFWLGILGPSGTWFLRRLADGLDRSPDGFVLDLRTAAKSLGLSPTGGRTFSFHRMLERCQRFGMIRFQGTNLEARRRIAAVPRRHLQRLPYELQEAHRKWEKSPH